jgi:HK97 family phage major capsid protein
MADITREDVATLIQEDYSTTLLDTAAAESGAIAAFGTVNLGTKVTNLPVLTSLPEASWVSESATDDDGRKPTSKATWGNKQFVVEELAVIVPVHEDVLDDADDALLASITASGGTAIGKKLDEAVIFGKDKPVTWTSLSLLGAAEEDGNLFVASPTAGVNDLAGSIYQAAEAVDDSGADPNVILTRSGLRFALANLRNADGSTIYQSTISANGDMSDSIAGLTAAWVKNGAWDRTLATAIVADSTKVKIGVRQDITVKFLDQATVDGINLAERDMVAFRFKARYAYVLGNVLNSTGSISSPTAAVVPSGAGASPAADNS